jgi:hypothetical protein
MKISKKSASVKKRQREKNQYLQYIKRRQSREGIGRAVREMNGHSGKEGEHYKMRN